MLRHAAARSADAMPYDDAAYARYVTPLLPLYMMLLPLHATMLLLPLLFRDAVAYITFSRIRAIMLLIFYA